MHYATPAARISRWLLVLLLLAPTYAAAQSTFRRAPRPGTGLEVENAFTVPFIFSVDGLDRAEGSRLQTELRLAVTEHAESLGKMVLVQSPLPYRVHVNVRVDRSRRAFTTVSFERSVTYTVGRRDRVRTYEAPAVLTYSVLDRPYTQSGVLADARTLTENLLVSLVPPTQ